ncbi:hypothetical protein K0I73_13025 [Shewanella mesophila]|uniref:hypothetical protein n=1 Tax=Shewanella mesophila TaxID=2864208 RepID=UPI001C65B71B|nr:hypothetical protein [Shewanella mesophila]QYJ85138.1 hypothetical protein K0I73_13025 [Shewanella mesophila]
MKDNLKTQLSDSYLRKLYHMQATEQPSQQLDNKVLAQASAQISKPTDNVVKPHANFWRQYRWPISSAASVMLVVTLLLINPSMQDEVLTDDAIMPQSAPMLMQHEPKLRQSATPTGGGTGTEEGARLSVAKPTLGPSAEGAARSENMDKRESSTAQSFSNNMDTLSAEHEQQPRAMISDLQAVNHLSQLVAGQLWAQASVLSQKMAKERPQLDDKQHPQHQQWSSLLKQIADHS